ncbi:conserved hypothetical protein [Formosa agariphila KMM 3901]|uniref:Lipocalin-like domain-containing protein n=1 Tax=Formosa agariphila (strain DSM 15362 / KCTC 12365 / LMG 23005 / KMM 3901 / M-2Alg 35-1) TaxID=1347342 RepID=T2KKW2_FORAG|nr:hypothetical protein [Formosa agariphila]CDF79532.1 conserved hypothetical protein [Formosa agariphila KMM 3901]
MNVGKSLFVNVLKNVFVSVFVSLIITACSTDDDTSLQSYTLEDLEVMHNNSSKTWRLQAYYRNYDTNLSEQNDCLVDDIYTFKPAGEVDVISGTESCYYGGSEIAEAQYTFYEESGSVFFTMIRGKITEDITSSTSFSLKLTDLSANRMVFSASDSLDNASALVFVAD